jgi:metallo-beta-lactamase family protein
MARQAKLTFLGAARNVTGSRYLLECNGARLLIDCGIYQERDFRARNWDPAPVPAQSLDAVLLTHAHLDHCGWLPRLVKQGFHGRIYCTSATAEIARIVLLDAAKLQEEDAEFKRRRHEQEGRRGPYPVEPLYTGEDVEATTPLFTPVRYESPVPLGDGIEAAFYDAGHILGSSMIRLRLDLNGSRRTLLFSGDVGRRNTPIIRDPSVFEEADYVQIESTYGDRLHEDQEDIADKLAQIILSTRKAGGNVVIPSFAVERSQELLYRLNELQREDRIPHLLIFIDSPMAIKVTDIFERHSEMFDEEMLERMRRQESLFELPNLKMTRDTQESKAINHIRGTVIIIAGSGMCTGGRIKHHLVNNITRKRSTILFVGYQAVGTLGRSIVDGAKRVRILGKKYPVRARVEQLHGFSAHADRDELFAWLSHLSRPPRRIFITHGETHAAEAFAQFVREKSGWNTSVPDYLDEAVLE